MKNEIFDSLIISFNKYTRISITYNKYVQKRKFLRLIFHPDLVTIFLIHTRLAYIDRCANLLKSYAEYQENIQTTD